MAQKTIRTIAPNGMKMSRNSMCPALHAERGAACAGGPALEAHIVRHDPARVLRELDAKRRILALYATATEDRTALRARMREVIDKDPDEFSRLHRQESELIEMAGRMAPVVRLLALPYVDRPGYREEWRP
ncbi:DUF6221 family protein [Streptomyces sp. NPDC056159]|uniref:DUF6221 family protein n=1 Tax=unclassified Streptomyces TaxID=2593676 RepID=UPI003417D4E5